MRFSSPPPIRPYRSQTENTGSPVPVSRPKFSVNTVQFIPLIIDSKLPVPGNGEIQDSLLTLPFGTTSVLDYLLQRLQDYGGNRRLIVPLHSVGPTYRDRIEASSTAALQVLSPQEVAEFADGSEPSDFLFIIDPRCWPTAGYQVEELVEVCQRYRGAVHAVAIGQDLELMREVVEKDGQGRVKRVRRLYNRMSWPEVTSVGVFASVVPARSLCDVQLGSLADLRGQLAAKGVFTQDIPVRSNIHHINDEEGLLVLNGMAVGQAFEEPIPEGFRAQRDDVLVGSHCTIHPTVSLIGPLVIQPEVRIERGATVIGPAVIGRGARIRRDAVVSGAMLGCFTAGGAARGIAGGVVLGRKVARPRGRGSEPAFAEESSHGVSRPTHGMQDSEPARGQPVQLALKRLLDAIGAAAGLLMLSPFLLFLAALIKITSRGPVLFVHPREGRGGKEFPCLKFRTMVADAHRLQRELYDRNEVDGPQFKISGDPRITPIGHWLRRTNLDELPQLINVLLGHMSLVGPRPSPFRENQICVPWRRARLSVKPGITGLWQLCRERGQEGDFHEWIYYDLAYVRHLSIWLDLKILFRTVLSRGGGRRCKMSMFIAADDAHGLPEGDPPSSGSDEHSEVPAEVIT